VAKPAPGPAVDRRRPLPGVREFVGVVAGLITGGFAAWAYYDDWFRPGAHAFGLWIAVVALTSAGQRPRRAVGQAVLTLAAAVIAFYVGKKAMYGIDYPGMPYVLNLSDLVEWLALAAVAGALLGWVFSWGGRPGAVGCSRCRSAPGDSWPWWPPGPCRRRSSATSWSRLPICSSRC
jgi:hypothetical protein